jgi:hypothetical protein
MPIPAIAAGLVAAGKTKAGQAVLKKAGDLISGGSQDQKENLFLRHRDDVYKLLRSNAWTPEKEWAPIAEQYRMSIKDITDSTAVEFARLHAFIQDYLNKKQPGLGNAFTVKQWQIAEQLKVEYNDPSRSYKGASVQGLEWALANRNNVNVTEILNNSDGLGISQAYVNSQGQIVVPSTQQGEGIFSQLNNYASNQLNKVGGQILSNAAAAVSGQQQIASGGGVTLTGGVEIGGSVTKNTTSNGDDKSSNGMLWILGLVVLGFMFFTGGLKKLFK